MNRPSWITFDCYDTLVECPIGEVSLDIMGARANGIDRERFLADFEKLRYDTTTHGPYRPYRDVLRGTLAQIMRTYALPYREEDGDALIAAVPT